MSVIGRSFIVALVCFLLHGSIIYIVKPWWNTSQHQWQDSIIKSEQFIYSQQLPDYIIAGSSLASRIVADSLPNTQSLAFGGMSAIDGLNLINNSSDVPKYILLEINVVKAEKDGFIENLTKPTAFYPKKLIPSLREQYQPIGLISNILASKITKPMLAPFANKSQGLHQNSERPSVKKESTFDRMLKLNQQNHQTPPLQLKEHFGLLTEKIRAVEKKGVKVVFMELPIDASLCNSVKSKAVRNLFLESFPKEHYIYIDQPNCHDYQTSDGLHLPYEQALKYTKYLRSEINQHIKSH